MKLLQLIGLFLCSLFIVSADYCDDIPPARIEPCEDQRGKLIFLLLC